MCQATSKPAAVASLVTAQVVGDPATPLSNFNQGLELEVSHFKKV